MIVGDFLENSVSVFVFTLFTLTVSVARRNRLLEAAKNLFLHLFFSLSSWTKPILLPACFRKKAIGASPIMHLIPRRSPLVRCEHGYILLWL